jgi:hypothetical protein
MLTGLVLSGVLALAPQLPPAAGGTAPPRQDAPAAPFSRLFEPATPGTAETQLIPGVPPRPAPRLVPPATQAPAGPRTKVVCGMTLIIVGSELDPDMPKAPRKDGVTYTMRRFPPPACGKEK